MEGASFNILLVEGKRRANHATCTGSIFVRRRAALVSHLSAIHKACPHLTGTRHPNHWTKATERIGLHPHNSDQTAEPADPEGAPDLERYPGYPMWELIKRPLQWVAYLVTLGIWLKSSSKENCLFGKDACWVLGGMPVHLFASHTPCKQP